MNAQERYLIRSFYRKIQLGLKYVENQYIWQAATGASHAKHRYLEQATKINSSLKDYMLNNK